VMGRLPNMALQRTRRPRCRSGLSLRSLGSPLNARPLDGHQRFPLEAHESPEQASSTSALRKLRMVGAVAAMLALLGIAALVIWFILRYPRF
jgi:hypothetical protein